MSQRNLCAVVLLAMLAACGKPVDNVSAAKPASPAQAPKAGIAWTHAASDADVDAQIHAVRGDDVADVMFTSGTTGAPKGVPMTHAQNLRQLAFSCELAALEEIAKSRGAKGLAYLICDEETGEIRSPIAKFLERNPDGGIHHVCYEVDDILAARDRLAAGGARVLGDGTPKIGAHGKPVLFLHPKDFLGTLVELEQA